MPLVGNLGSVTYVSFDALTLLGDTKGIWPVKKPVPRVTELAENRAGPANPDSPGKWPSRRW